MVVYQYRFRNIVIRWTVIEPFSRYFGFLGCSAKECSIGCSHLEWLEGVHEF
jgi:hypothetical protein